jgi:hypothetical protein
MSTTYQPGNVPDHPVELIQFLRRELAAGGQGQEASQTSARDIPEWRRAVRSFWTNPSPATAFRV